MTRSQKKERISTLFDKKSLVDIETAFCKALDKLHKSEKHICYVPAMGHQFRRGRTKLTVYVSSLG